MVIPTTPVAQPPPVSTIIAERLAVAVEEGHDVAVAFSEHPDLHSLYPELLRMLHGTIRAGVPLLRAAEHEAVRRSTSGDPVASELIPYLQQHAVEELHHDEWLLDDYAALGLDPHQVEERPPSTTVAALVGAIYYWIRHYHPVAILGYLAVTEGWPPSVELIDELQQRSGYPADAFTTLRHHSAIDPGHGDDLWIFMDSLDLTRDQIQVIGDAAVHSITLEIAAIDELVAPQPAHLLHP